MRMNLVSWPLASLILAVVAWPALSDDAKPVPSIDAAASAPESTAASSEATPELRSELKAIQAKYGEAMKRARPQPMDQKLTDEEKKAIAKARQAAFTEYKNDVIKLVRRANKLHDEQLTTEDHATLADAYALLGKQKDVIKHARLVVKAQADHAGANLHLIRALAGTEEMTDAVAAFEAAQAAGVDEEQLVDARYSLYLGFVRAEKWGEASHYIAAVVAARRDKLANAGLALSYLRNVDSLVRAVKSAENDDAALARLAEEIEAARARLAAKSGNTELDVVAGLEARRVRLLGEGKKWDQAAEKVGPLLAEAQAALEAAPDDLPSLRRVAEFLAARADAARSAEHESADETRQAWVDFLARHSQRLAGKIELLQDYGSAVQRTALQLADAERTDEALALLDEFRGRFDALPADVTENEAVESLGKSIDSVVRRIKAQILRGQLIGQAMPPLEVDAWVNGSALSNEELRGKVVLLDFWAVWCGPCRATFPHLREWHEKYADRGLAIIGLTRYYQYGWDAEEQTHTEIDDLPAADEQAALVEFARHHDLRHRLAYMPEASKLSEQYGVTGIPQVVVIDREGVVRLIRVGSGDANTHDIDELLKELLGAEPAAAAPAGG